MLDPLLTLASSREACGLDYSCADPTDQPALFAQNGGLRAGPARRCLAGAYVRAADRGALTRDLPLLVFPCVLLLRPSQQGLDWTTNVATAAFQRRDAGPIQRSNTRARQ